MTSCCYEGCNRKYHIDCGFDKGRGGFSLSERGILSFSCKAHFKHQLFCHCNKKYDDSKGMVSLNILQKKTYRNHCVLLNLICRFTVMNVGSGYIMPVKG